MTVADTSSQHMADAELAEAEFMHAFESAAPPAVAKVLGIATTRIGDGVVLSMRNDPTGGYWNKALGFGVTERVTQALVEEILSFYRANGSTVACLQVAPAALPEDWDEICARNGIVAGSMWVKLLRGTEPAPQAATDLRIDRVGEADAREWAEVYCAGFGMPVGPLSEMFAAAVSAPGFLGLGAWDGPTMVSAGNLYVHEGRAAFCGVATLPQARGHAAQSMFMRRRVEAALEARVRVMSAETWAEGPGEHNPSLHNIRRAGFRYVYQRQNWVWRRPG